METTAETQGTQEQPNAQAEPAEQTQQTSSPNTSMQGAPDWVPKRMGELAAARREAEARAAAEQQKREQLEQELATLRAGNNQQQEQTPPPAQNVEQLARMYAEQMVRQQTEQQTMATRIAEIEKAGAEEFGDQFTAAIKNLSLAGVQSNDFLLALTNVPNPQKVVTFLGQNDNVGEAIRIAGLSPIQMGIEMTKISSKAAKELGKQISKAPAPVGTVEGGGSGGEGAEPKIGTPEWFQWRNKTARRR